MNHRQHWIPRLCVAVAAISVALLAGCDERCPTLEACDIRDAACQRHAANAAACLRGGDPASPEIEVVDAETFIQGEVDMDSPSADTRDLRRGLALLGLEPAEYESETRVRDYWNTIGAFYSYDTGKVTVLDRGHAMDGSGIVALLVHEIVHAMQHAELGDEYFAMHGNTFDSDLAFSAIREGEAVLYQDLATVRGFDLDPKDVPWRGVFLAFQAEQRERLRADEAKYQLAGRRFPYAFGGGYMNTAWREGGSDAVRAVYEELPTSTREVLAGYGATPFRGSSFEEPPDDVGVPLVVDGHELFATRHLGAWLFDPFQDASTTPSPDRPDVRFAGDVLSVWRSPITDDITSVWRLRFDDSVGADQFRSVLLVRPGTAVSVDDRDVVIVGSTDENFPVTIIDALQWGPAPVNDWADVPAAAGDHRNDLHCVIPATEP